jgi:hypothetical protein
MSSSDGSLGEDARLELLLEGADEISLRSDDESSLEREGSLSLPLSWTGVSIGVMVGSIGVIVNNGSVLAELVAREAESLSESCAIVGSSRWRPIEARVTVRMICGGKALAMFSEVAAN